MEFFAEYGLFLAKVVTVVLALIVVIAAIAAQKQQNKAQDLLGGHVEIKKLNDHFEQIEQDLKEHILSEKQLKQLAKAKKKQDKKQKKDDEDAERPRIFYVAFEGDVEASAVENLRHEISAILMIAQPTDEVVINVESPGGMVHTYGLAASQLQRVRAAGVPLTICVDKVAASGGYLMACVGNKILAAPFAIIGSIGVLAQIPNFNRALKRFDVDYEVMTAGEFKAPVTMFGEITDKGRSKLQEELESTHGLFKHFIEQHRPQVPLTEVATGEVWYGTQAIDRQLIDEITTSDDYLLKQAKDKDIFVIEFIEKKSLQEKLGFLMQSSVLAVYDRIMHRSQNSRFDKC